MKTRMPLMVLISLALAGAATAATGADILRMPLLPAAVGMGEAYACLADDVNAPLYNPAGLAAARVFQFSLIHASQMNDSIEYVAFAKPLRVPGTLGLNLIYRHTPDINNNGALDEPIKSEDVVVNLAYALQLKYLTTSLEEWSMGINLKWLRSTLGIHQATAVGFDTGVRWVSNTLEGLAAGVVLKNIGTPLKYIKVENSLPSGADAGVSYTFLGAGHHQVTAAGDVAVLFETGSLSTGVGLQYVFNDMFFIRGGYRYVPNSLVSVLTGGLGFHYRIQRIWLEADYAFKPVIFSDQSFETEHLISLTLGL